MFKRNLLALSLAVAALVFAATPAFGHATPVKMTPAPDSTVSAPTEISITFSEALEPKFSVIQLADSTGKIVSTAGAVLDKANAKHMTLALPKLPPGVYTVKWTSSAADDGHRLSRSYTFTIK
jgi:methionine-rich copper-binding protein CopC